MTIDELISYKELGIAVIALVAIYSYSKWASGESSKQAEYANNKLNDFINNAYKENTKCLAELNASLNEFNNSKTDIVLGIKELHHLIKHQHEIIKTQQDIAFQQSAILRNQQKK